MLVYAPTKAPFKAPATLHRRLAAATLERHGIRPVARPHAELSPANPVAAGRAWLEMVTLKPHNLPLWSLTAVTITEVN